MVSGWLPRPYALVVAVLNAATVYGANGWFDNYFCLGLLALGGALVLGSVPRIARALKLKETVPLGIGLVLLVLSRPYEGGVVSIHV
jgi:hypothetical protein